MTRSPIADPTRPHRRSPASSTAQACPTSASESYPGKIIAIEGTDGVGRSTQIRLLREWLEVQGYGVIETGWTRSVLMQPTIDLAKASNTLNKLTFVLLYATDFADRLEKEIIPALKAGFIVLADRYIFTALARARVRGVDRAYLRNLYGFAIAPHLVFYLKLDVDTLIRRVLSAGGMDFWESGMDMKLGDDIYDSFRTYQTKLLREYNAARRGVRLPHARRAALHRTHPGGSAAPDRRVPRRERDARDAVTTRRATLPASARCQFGRATAWPRRSASREGGQGCLGPRHG